MIKTKPSEISKCFARTFGWGEIESAARAVVKICLKRGDSWEQGISIEYMRGEYRRLGFVYLVSHGFLEIFEDFGDHPWYYKPTEKFVAALHLEKDEEDWMKKIIIFNQQFE